MNEREIKWMMAGVFLMGWNLASMVFDNPISWHVFLVMDLCLINAVARQAGEGWQMLRQYIVLEANKKDKES